MEAFDFAELFEYLADSRRRFLTAFRKLGWEEVNKNREATHHSMHGIFMHMLEVEDSYLHYDIPGIPWPHGDRDPIVFDTLEKMEEYDQDVAGRTREFFALLTSDDLGREVSIPDWGEKTSMEHVLLHTFLDEMAHLGELVCLMWQLDVEPPFRSIVKDWKSPRSSKKRMIANRSMPSSTVIPELVYPDVTKAAEWLRDAFGFTERLRIGEHRAQLNVGEGSVVVAAGHPPKGHDETSHSVMVRVEDVDGHFEHARARGVKILQPPADYPYGERQYTAEDLGGHRWTFSQSIADVAPEEWGGKRPSRTNSSARE